MKPIAVPAKFSDIVSDTNKDIRKNNQDVTKARMHIRQTVTAYDNPLTDELTIDRGRARASLEQLTEGLNTGVVIKSTV